ncbi:DUF7927 domain-containing protein [Jiangella endophytica]|uniref:DUF7927 domain-containing protein n=1 Tax=Jiangella endophytica TaxID=1623398 RepID=UPI0018E54B04|nr:LPXTG cell wall anchor domain-containing protein [Jiangella endophytica]
MAIATTGVADAAPVYEITGRWIDPPDVVASGTPVVAEWRVNVNDDQEAPGNEDVDNVNFSVTLEHGFFDAVPEACLTNDVDPVSEISADRRTLLCNLGTHREGTAVVVQTGIEADGETGDEVSAIGTIDGLTAEVPPIPIDNPFRMDIAWSSSTAGVAYDDEGDFVDLDLEWTLFLGAGSDPGPDSVTYTLTTSTGTGAALAVGPNACSAFAGGAAGNPAGAIGHPWSDDTHAAEQTAPFVDSCTLTQTGPNTFALTLAGIDYSRVQVPTQDSTGRPLPTDTQAVASGSVWFRVAGVQNDSITLTSDAPVYTSPAGETSEDDPANNVSSKTWTRGGWSNAYRPDYSGIEVPSWWSNQFKVSPGTVVDATTVHGLGTGDHAPTDVISQCVILDSAHVTFTDYDLWTSWGGPSVVGATVEYYVGTEASVTPGSGGYDPNGFTCATDPGGWTTTEPADLSTVKAVRATYPFAAVAGAANVPLQVHFVVNDDTPIGQDVWEFGELAINGDWSRPSRTLDPTDGSGPRTPGMRYPYIGSGRDVLYVIGATPAVTKTAEQSVVTPGVPVDFTLTYSANGTGAIPPTVDGYQLVDTLPPGMTYVEGSADPEPVVAPDGSGRYVLTWNLDGVATNVANELTYQAVADSSVEPGTRLTNTVEATYGDISVDDDAQVAVSTDGYTTILKTSDVEYIPNVNGYGVGSGSWTVTIESADPYPQAFTDTIDILPYNGDQRGTSFSGAYTLDDVVLPDGGTLYYTDADPATLIDDPADASNGAAGDPSGNTAGWTTTRPAAPTAIRVIGPELASGGTFSFQVPITTDGAEAGDVYVNRAQARAEHTELVMRTSAPLYVSDYAVAKTSDPAPGSTVQPGDTITYTITVAQEGPVPASAAWTDSLEDVLDDAVYNDDAAADIGAVTYADGVLSWEGVVPVGEVATITYSVTVKDVAGLEADGDTVVDNSVWSPGCPDAAEGEENPCEPPPIRVGWYEYSKTADPAPGSTVLVGEIVTYTVLIEQHGEGAVAGAFVEDDLTAVLDDATWNDDAAATSGTVSYTEPTLRWDGDLAVGDVVTLTYSVTTTAVGEGDDQLHNVVTSVCEPDDPDCHPGVCVPAPDENPNCETDHVKGDYVVTKTSDPATGSEVEVGDVITYTVTVTQNGAGAVAEAGFTDDMTQVLDDATYNDDAAASSGPEPTYDEPTLAWSGPLAVGEVVTVTYSVTVTAEGDRFLKNVVMTPDPEQCVPLEGQDEACTTEHVNGEFTYSKTSDPEPGATVEEGDVVTYTVVISQVGAAPVEGATVDDDLSAVLDDATWNDDATASAGEVSFADPTLTWTGDLAVGDVVTLTYSVTVGPLGEGDDQLKNVVTSPHPDGVCVPAADENPDCTTTHVMGDYVVAKTSDPESGATVEEGDVVTYTVTVTHTFGAPVGASFEDDLADVLDDATWNDDLEASGGEAAFDGTTLTWAGDLAAGDVVTVTYSVTVTSDGDQHLRNVVTTPDPEHCVPAEGQDKACTTEHFSSGYTYSKTSDPAPGSDVEEGDVITYTVLVEQDGPVPVIGATVTDDLSGVSPYADWNDDAAATSGEVSLDGTQLTWTGDLAVGQIVTITYSVTVGDAENATIRNVVTSLDDDATCVPAPDGNPDCRTEHYTPGAQPPAPEEPGEPGEPDLPDTGADSMSVALTAGAVLLLAGAGFGLVARRRRGSATEGGSTG